jgi:hypothetical protein
MWGRETVGWNVVGAWYLGLEHVDMEVFSIKRQVSILSSFYAMYLIIRIQVIMLLELHVCSNFASE